MKFHKDIGKASRDQLTMEQMLCQCVIGHVLSNKQSFISFAATTKQIYESFVPELANRLSFFLEAQKHFPGYHSSVLNVLPGQLQIWNNHSTLGKRTQFDIIVNSLWVEFANVEQANPRQYSSWCMCIDTATSIDPS
jgi:hypothetical protein